MQFLVILLIILSFLVWPTYGVITREITVSGGTIKRDDTPMYFWSMISFLYLCAIAFPCIMWQVPFAGIFLPIMYVMLRVIILFWILKL